MKNVTSKTIPSLHIETSNAEALKQKAKVDEI